MNLCTVRIAAQIGDSRRPLHDECQMPPPPGTQRADLVFFLTRAAWPHLKASHGVVVNTASLNGLLSFKTLGSLAHTTAKAGIIAMTRQLAMEGREHGIRANSISPGLIETNEPRACILSTA
jgi:NAD(P)-dependent dehydrogenase (short-subunit alcohol dehydrogenase family)